MATLLQGCEPDRLRLEGGPVVIQTNGPPPSGTSKTTALGHAGVWDVHRSIALAPAPRQPFLATAFHRPCGTFLRRPASRAAFSPVLHWSPVMFAVPTVPVAQALSPVPAVPAVLAVPVSPVVLVSLVLGIAAAGPPLAPPRPERTRPKIRTAAATHQTGLRKPRPNRATRRHRRRRCRALNRRQYVRTLSGIWPGA